MRKVKIKRHGVFNKDENKWDYIEITGLFHAWGQYSQELRDGVSIDSAAIVELDTGEIVMPDATNIVFLDRETPAAE